MEGGGLKYPDMQRNMSINIKSVAGAFTFLFSLCLFNFRSFLPLFCLSFLYFFFFFNPYTTFDLIWSAIFNEMAEMMRTPTLVCKKKSRRWEEDHFGNDVKLEWICESKETISLKRLRSFFSSLSLIIQLIRNKIFLFARK